jgi:hypothetical protein
VERVGLELEIVSSEHIFLFLSLEGLFILASALHGASERECGSRGECPVGLCTPIFHL